MSNASTAFETDILNNLRGEVIPGKTLYLGLFDGDPGPLGSNASEVTGAISSNGRAQISFGAVTNPLPNSAVLDFGTAIGAAAVNGFGIFDAAVSGNLVLHGVVAPSQTIQTGNQVSIGVGQLQITVS